MDGGGNEVASGTRVTLVTVWRASEVGERPGASGRTPEESFQRWEGRRCFDRVSRWLWQLSLLTTAVPGL
eukprot:2437185-Rhodomonas_salina.1